MTTEISARTIIKVVLIVLAVVFIFILRDVIFVFLFSVFLAAAITPMVSWFERRRVPRLVAVLGIYLFCCALIVLLLSFVVPVAANELNQLTQALPEFFEHRLETDSNSERYLVFMEELQHFLKEASDYLTVSPGSITTLFVDTLSGLILLISIVVISFYFSVMEHGVVSFFKSVVPKVHEDYVTQLWHRIESKVGRWFRGQLLLALIVGSIVYLGLSILGVKYALLLGVVAMLLELVPFVGPIIAAIPAILLAFLQAPMMALWVAVLYLVIQQLENQFLAPLILGKSTDMHPITVIIALLIGAKVAGILGMLLAVPVAVVLMEIFEDLAQQRRHLPSTPMPT